MPALPFDIVVFDLDGTLADTAPDLAASLNHVLTSLDRAELAHRAVRRMIGGGVRLLVRRGLEATGGASEMMIDHAYALFMAHYRDHLCVGTRPYEGADEALSTVSQAGARLALCTNKPESLARSLVERLRWRFDAIIGGDTLSVRKPDPAPLREAIARAGGCRAVLVGDSITDSETAHAAGIPFVAVSFGYSDRPIEALGAAAIIDRLAELPYALAGL